jgi:DNA-binding NtrC family response regulator
MGEKARVLIADDNVSLCRTMALALRRKGYDVATAEDGPGAVEAVKTGSFDVIFLDIKMPVMDGVETFREIRRTGCNAVVVMMTAYAVEDLVQDALKEGAHGVVYKPLDIDKVINLIEDVGETREGALILVVDDDPGLCATMKNVLMTKRYTVGVASTGEEAIALAREKDFDIIFIDMKLPTINGLETYLAIRKLDPKVVAIMMTAHRQEMSDLVEQALESTAYTCLYKPLDMELVFNLVDEVWARKQGSGPTEAGMLGDKRENPDR